MIDFIKENNYLDHAATTYVRPEVLEKMLPFFSEKFGNPSSLYDIAQESKNAIEEAIIEGKIDNNHEDALKYLENIKNEYVNF